MQSMVLWYCISPNIDCHRWGFAMSDSDKIELACIIVRCSKKSRTCLSRTLSGMYKLWDWPALTYVILHYLLLIVGVSGGVGVQSRSMALACIKNAMLLDVNFSSNKMWCYFKLASRHIRNATLNQDTWCKIEVATLLGIKLYHFKQDAMLLEVNILQHDDATLLWF